MSRSVFGHKMEKKSWDSDHFDQESEFKKMGWVFLGLIALFIIIAIFMWWMRNSLK